LRAPPAWCALSERGRGPPVADCECSTRGQCPEQEGDLLEGRQIQGLKVILKTQGAVEVALHVNSVLEIGLGQAQRIT
jgi:hypothetical protein